MDNSEIQMVLADGGFYRGGIDGLIGDKSIFGVRAALAEFGLAGAGFEGRRAVIAAVQAVLNAGGYMAGAVDGLEGHNTREALNSFLFKKTTGKPERVVRQPRSDRPAPDLVPHQNQVGRYYGRPGPDIEAQLTTIKFPFSFRIDWDLGVTTNKIRVHTKAATSLKAALIEVRNHYGSDEWKRLGLDRYAGAYNHRKMRGGSKWSMHAYGCAIDFFAAPNSLRMRCPDALFCGHEYKPFLDIMERNEWLPAIRLWGADAMHFQRATL